MWIVKGGWRGEGPALLVTVSGPMCGVLFAWGWGLRCRGVGGLARVWRDSF